jgi:hypothetical protein
MQRENRSVESGIHVAYATGRVVAEMARNGYYTIHDHICDGLGEAMQRLARECNADAELFWEAYQLGRDFESERLAQRDDASYDALCDFVDDGLRSLANSAIRL